MNKHSKYCILKNNSYETVHDIKINAKTRGAGIIKGQGWHTRGKWHFLDKNVNNP